ncbi:hypothetical protein E3N88_21563 [Mikania micrantha]|uniref:Uncharacterized protein n=1 Tax=Mikania micrantha TaxID=192012 RepID=A0A5N6N7V8_9ASTR|nr:hypothetical protein E3N88_21563 [Mikania micrantha]
MAQGFHGSEPQATKLKCITSEVSASLLEAFDRTFECTVMGKRRVSVSDNPSKDREDSWKKIFKGLVDMVEDQQRQLESLAVERKSLEKRFRVQHDRWVSDVKLLEDHILQMARDSKIKDMVRFAENAKGNLIISMKQKEAIINKLKFEEVDDERADLKLLFDELSRYLTAPKHATPSDGKDAAESSLKAERDFAWNQYRKTDKKFQELVKRTKFEVEGANEKLQQLISDLEQSKSLNMEKDRKISSLRDDIVVLQLESRKKSEEISRLTKEQELLRGDSDRSITPVLRRCMAESSKNSHSSDMAIIEKGRGSSKRKVIESEPRLFTSKFKVPRGFETYVVKSLVDLQFRPTNVERVLCYGVQRLYQKTLGGRKIEDVGIIFFTHRRLLTGTSPSTFFHPKNLHVSRSRGLRPADNPMSSEISQSDSESDSSDAEPKSRNEKKREARRAVRWGMELAEFNDSQIKRVLR